MAAVVDRLGNWHDPNTGRFMPKGGRAERRDPKTPAAAEPGTIDARRLRRASDTEVLGLFRKLLDRADLDSNPRVAALAKQVGDELDRRDAKRERTPSKSDRVSELVAAGLDYREAYAEAHGLDPEQLAAADRRALIAANRLHPGEHWTKVVARMYHERVAVDYLAAEEATNGNLLSKRGRARGIDPAELWTMPAERAARYASDELKEWWQAHGGRLTPSMFRDQVLPTRGSRKAARRAKHAGQGRDYGV